MHAFDFIVGTAAFNGGPVDNGCAAGDGIAHVGLLKDLFEASAGAAVDKELIGDKVCVAGAIDETEKALFDGVGDGDFEVEVPGGGGSGS